MAEPDTVTLVCSPLNMLEENMVGSLAKQAVSAIAINSDSLSEARHIGRDLVSEARTGKFQVILMSPEMFLSSLFTRLAEDRPFRQRLRHFIVNECHIILLWKELRPKYSFLGDMRSLLPEHVSFAAMTATLPLGEPMALVLRTLGFRRPNYIIDHHDCQRYDIDLYFRTLSHGIGGRDVLVFPDLNWLIAPDIASAADIPKTLIYCDSIELGYRVSVYLRSLLPASLKPDENRAITLVHGLSCPHCKSDALATLLQSGADRQCAVHVATDVLAMGIDVSDIKQVICFGTPKSLATMLKHIGRAARARNRRGSTYVYLHQADMKRAHAAAERTHYDDVPASRPHGKKASKVVARASQDETAWSNTPCPALDRVLIAVASNSCVNLPINIAMGNKNVAPEYTCGACSSCLGDTLPQARARDSAPDTPDGDSHSAPGVSALADIEVVIRGLEDIAFAIWSSSNTAEDVASTVFLSDKWANTIVTSLESLTSLDSIRSALAGWRHWDVHGAKLAHKILENRGTCNGKKASGG
ncbi:P-loop containing nucleoside triphosphate hydrolase protein [Auricularia subglabra TFB-10046 SS5]|nr:P-loop containing nucleoside triphosphate hydrolase protein [Auricularia subglabra TFB-10046 SS5]